MAATDTPTIRYVGLYYPELLQDFIAARRSNVPELTDEDPHEPTVQMLRAFALGMHYMASLTDHVAQETMLSTARLRESVRGQLALIDYQLRQQTPAVVDLILLLTTPLPADTGISALALFATEGTETDPEIVFELTAEHLLSQSDEVSRCYEYDAGTLTLTDRTTKANTDADTWTPWGGADAAGDMLIFGHANVLFDRVDLRFTAAVTVPDDDELVLEYYDGQVDDANPTSVEMVGPVLRVHVNTLLGSVDRRGSIVRIRLASTGAYEEVASLYTSGDNYVDLVAYLGQTVVSTDPGDYIVGAAWKEPAGVAKALSADGLTLQITWTLPETLQRMWQTQTDAGGFVYYPARLRVVNPLAVALPVLDRVLIDQGNQYAKISVTQGTTAVDDPAGSSDGTASQTITTVRGDVIADTVDVSVDDGGGYQSWDQVDNFLASSSTSRHYTVDYDADGFALVTFGDGTNGAIPPIGSDYKIDYRWGAVDDGNVGAGTIVVNKSGESLIGQVANPRSASGWAAAEGSTDTDLARVKIAGPASLRTRDRALTAGDCETLATGSFVTAAGSAPVARAQAVEDGLGPKTILLYVIGAGGTSINAATLAELGTYFNGDPLTGADGVLVLNSELTPQNFGSQAVSVTATVKGGNKTKIEQALIALLGPLSLEEDGTYVHTAGGTIYRERIIAEIFAADPGKVKNVVMPTPAADVTLAAGFLPRAGTITITIV